ncbi:hypothetical protein F7725_022651, partial [Dissostichus mawsoni]
MKKDIDTLIAEERAEIIAKYDKGRQEGVNIDPWEDADYSIYKVTDRFGFLHEEELPTPSALEEKQKQLEIERVEKWLKMSKKWDKYKNSEKLVKRVYKGIPLQLRGQAWALLLDVEKVKQENVGKYERMKLQARNFSTEIKQIDLDVTERSGTTSCSWTALESSKQQALFHVLAAYSVYNTEVSYCQGMSQIAAILLMYLNEEEAFWALSQLLTNSKHAMHGFFIPGFPKLHRFQAHHELILSKMLPKLKKHWEFIQEQLEVSFFLHDDVVVEQLQASMSELRSKKLDQPPPAKSEEVPKKPLGQERPVALLPKQPDSPLEVKVNLQPHIPPTTEGPQMDSITRQQTPSPADMRTPPLASPDPVVVHTQRTPSPIRPCRKPPLPPKAEKPCAEAGPDREGKGTLPEVRHTENVLQSQPGDPQTQEEPVDWPPPYEPPAFEAVQTDAEIMDLPDLPPPPFFYTEPRPAAPSFPPLSPTTGHPNKAKTMPEATHRKPPPSKPTPPRALTTSSTSSPRPPPKPTKFPVSLYVPVPAGDRRPSNTSQYDNLSEAEEDERCLERLLGSTPEETHGIPPTPQTETMTPLSTLHLLRSSLPHLLSVLPRCAPSPEPEYEGEDSWVEDSIIPLLPPVLLTGSLPFSVALPAARTHREPPHPKPPHPKPPHPKPPHPEPPHPEPPHPEPPH